MSEVDTVVFSDLHGRISALEAVVATYGDSVRYVSAGDAIDSPEHGNTKATIELLQGIGAVCLYGNHEWVLSAALYCSDNEQKETWTKVWARYQSSVLASYGIPEPRKLYKDNIQEYYEAAEKLRNTMQEVGHTPFLEHLKPYYETENMLVIHGGVTSAIWKKQSKFLRSIVEGPLNKRQWHHEPDQIFDRRHWLSTTKKIPQNINKTFITGHTHSQKNEIERVTSDGRRIQLAGMTAVTSPLYVYENWTNKVVAIRPK